MCSVDALWEVRAIISLWVSGITSRHKFHTSRQANFAILILELLYSSLLLHCYWLRWKIQLLEEVQHVGFCMATSTSVYRLCHELVWIFTSGTNELKVQNNRLWRFYSISCKIGPIMWNSRSSNYVWSFRVMIPITV